MISYEESNLYTRDGLWEESKLHTRDMLGDSRREKQGLVWEETFELRSERYKKQLLQSPQDKNKLGMFRENQEIMMSIFWGIENNICSVT